MRPLEQAAAVSEGASTARNPRWTTLLDVSMLYASKTGAVLVGILILPQFSHLLGANQFGAVAVVLSFQALMLMLDLGMSTLVSRDLAADTVGPESVAVWRTGEAVVTLFYGALIPLVLLLSNVVATGLSHVQLLAALMLFWVLTVQNIGQAALLAKHHFVAAGSIQLASVGARGVGTLLALRFIGADLTVFLVAQLSFGFVQMVVTHKVCSQLTGVVAAAGAPFRPSLSQCLQMARRGRPLLWFGVAGAAVMQLDKPIITAFTSAAQISPYYLASTLCLTPLLVLGAPVAQYFQPRLVRAIASNDGDATRRVLKPFVTAIVVATMLPSAFVWMLREPIVSAWLGNSSLAYDVTHYTSILLPGVALGAIGFVPYSILVARQDYRFQAIGSTALTIVTLIATIAFARAQSVQGVCWVYAIYHAASTLMSWARCVLSQPEDAHYASAGALQTAVVVGITAFVVVTTITIGQHVF